VSLCEYHKILTEKGKREKEIEIESITKKKIRSKENKNDKRTVDDLHHVACLVSRQFYQQLQETFQTSVTKANTSLTVVLSVTFRWKH
jgi:hypothetical protein